MSNKLSGWMKKGRIRVVQERVLQALGVHRVSNDEEFEGRLKSFQKIITELRQVEDAIKVWMEAFKLMGELSENLGNAISQFYNPQISNDSSAKGLHKSPYANIARIYGAVQYDLNQIINHNVLKVMKDRVLSPLENLLSQEEKINIQLEKRKMLLLDRDSIKVRLDHEKNSNKKNENNVNRLTAKLQISQDALQVVEDEIMHVFDRFDENRNRFIGQEFASIIACQYHVGMESGNLFSLFLPYLPQSASSLCLLDSLNILKSVEIKPTNNMPNRRGSQDPKLLDSSRGNGSQRKISTKTEQERRRGRQLVPVPPIFGSHYVEGNLGVMSALSVDLDDVDDDEEQFLVISTDGQQRHHDNNSSYNNMAERPSLSRNIQKTDELQADISSEVKPAKMDSRLNSRMHKNSTASSSALKSSQSESERYERELLKESVSLLLSGVSTEVNESTETSQRNSPLDTPISSTKHPNTPIMANNDDYGSKISGFSDSSGGNDIAYRGDSGHEVIIVPLKNLSRSTTTSTAAGGAIGHKTGGVFFANSPPGSLASSPSSTASSAIPIEQILSNGIKEIENNIDATNVPLSFEDDDGHLDSKVPLSSEFTKLGTVDLDFDVEVVGGDNESKREYVKESELERRISSQIEEDPPDPITFRK